MSWNFQRIRINFLAIGMKRIRNSATNIMGEQERTVSSAATQEHQHQPFCPLRQLAAFQIYGLGIYEE